MPAVYFTFLIKFIVDLIFLRSLRSVFNDVGLNPTLYTNTIQKYYVQLVDLNIYSATNKQFLFKQLSKHCSCEENKEARAKLLGKQLTEGQ